MVCINQYKKINLKISINYSNRIDKLSRHDKIASDMFKLSRILRTRYFTTASHREDGRLDIVCTA